MLQKLKDLFSTTDTPGAAAIGKDKLAIATLLFEAAASDGVIDDSELAHIKTLLATHFTLQADQLETLCDEALKTQQNAIELSRFTRSVKDHFAFDERIAVIEMLWEVCYADGELDDYEANLMRRIGGLIYVDDKANGEARKRIASKQKL